MVGEVSRATSHLERGEESSYLTLETSEVEAMQQLYGQSITCRIAIGPRQSRKVFTMQSRRS